MNASSYLGKLIERQKSEGWSDREMAREIGVGNATWFRVRTGSRGMGVSLLQRCMNRFPEYDADALFFLRQPASESSISELHEEPTHVA